MSEEYRKLWHDRIDEVFDSKKNMQALTRIIMAAVMEVISQPHMDLKLKAKFDKGMAEHGMGFEKVDFDTEIENEILDLCNYFIGKHHALTANKPQGNKE